MTEVSRECWDEIQRELREGTPDTRERIALFKLADEIYARTSGKNQKDVVERIAAFLWVWRHSYSVAAESWGQVYPEVQAEYRYIASTAYRIARGLPHGG